MPDDCGCTYDEEIGAMSMCEPHWTALEAELDREPRVIPALLAALTKHKETL